MASSKSRRTDRIVIVASEFNKPVTDALVRGARQALARRGIAPGRVPCVWVPGAFELPAAAAALAAAKPAPDALIAVGCIIKGETPQYAILGQAVLHGLAYVSAQQRLPVGCGVVIADSMAQARARAARPGQGTRRAGGSKINRGEEAALAALALLAVMRRIRRGNASHA